MTLRVRITSPIWLRLEDAVIARCVLGNVADLTGNASARPDGTGWTWEPAAVRWTAGPLTRTTEAGRPVGCLTVTGAGELPEETLERLRRYLESKYR